MDDFIEIDIRQRIIKCMSVYGIEGTYDKIKDIYSNMDELREAWLEEYNKIIKDYIKKEKNNGR
jgi:hypothetical protein